MKKFIFALVSLLVLSSCNENSKKESDVTTTEKEEVIALATYQHFGEKISDKDVMTQEEMYKKYKNLTPGDTVTVKFAADVKSVCQSKGCWMRLDMGEEEAMVKFKDYGFFMPKDIAGEQVVVRGSAFIDEMSVEDQRHFAEDAGKSKEEIALITEPKRTLSFTADGVLLADKQ